MAPPLHDLSRMNTLCQRLGLQTPNIKVTSIQEYVPHVDVGVDFLERLPSPKRAELQKKIKGWKKTSSANDARAAAARDLVGALEDIVRVKDAEHEEQKRIQEAEVAARRAEKEVVLARKKKQREDELTERRKQKEVEAASKKRHLRPVAAGPAGISRNRVKDNDHKSSRSRVPSSTWAAILAESEASKRIDEPPASAKNAVTLAGKQSPTGPHRPRGAV